MTDKVQKIREEVEMVVNRRLNLLNGDYFDLNKEADGFTNEIMDIIDSLQEEQQVKKSAELQHVNDMCKENGDSLTQESVINVWHDMSEEAENGRNIIIIDPKDFYGAVLRRGGSQLKNHNKERYVKWAYIDELTEL